MDHCSSCNIKKPFPSALLTKHVRAARALMCAGCCCSLADCLPGQEVFSQLSWQVSHGQLAFISGANRCMFDLSLICDPVCLKSTSGCQNCQMCLILCPKRLFVHQTVVGEAEVVDAAGLVALRTVAISGTFALATSLAARSDLAHAAAHQICIQLWLASSLLADSLAVAAQTLLAQGLAANELGQVRKVILLLPSFHVPVFIVQRNELLAVCHL